MSKAFVKDEGVPQELEREAPALPDGKNYITPEGYARTYERGARAVVSASPSSLARVNAIAAQYKVQSQRIGTVSCGEFRIQYQGAFVIRGKADSFRRVWGESLGKTLESA